MSNPTHFDLFSGIGGFANIKFICYNKYMVNKYTYKAQVSKKELETAYSAGLTQVECAKKFNTTQKVIFALMKRYSIKARKAAPRNQKGEKNNNWRGDNVTKSAFHIRLYALWGKPKQCAVCGTKDKSKSFDYANLTGNYADINDYKPMCRSCHWVYDKKIFNIKYLREKYEKTHAL